ncbi:putative bacteriophage protein [Cupriavidus taiwanensis]|nr:putative bacteriophage protein [Cupriavidus taiwanensis]
MPAGLQTFDSAGNLKLSLGDRVGRFTGAVVTNGADGSLTIPGTDTGEAFFVLTSLENPMGWFSPPLVSISGSTISWTYLPTPGNPQRINCLIRYGVH